MHSIPQRISLVSQTRTILLDGIQTGTWQRELPGMRRLCEELHISRWTLHAALEGLQRDGFLEIRHGCACKILPRATRPSTFPRRPRRIALLVPQPLSRLRQFVSLWVDDLRLILADAELGLTVVTQPGAYRDKPDRVLRRMVNANPHDAWILMLCTRPVQAWFQETRVPAIVTGASAESVSLPALDPDHRAAGVHAGHVLLRLGHRRVTYVRPKVATAGVLATEAGLTAALQAEPYTQQSLAVLTADSYQEIKRTVERACRTPGPVGFVFAKAFAALTALTLLTSMGYRVPDEVSVVSVEPEPIFAHLVPTMAHYTLSPAIYAKRMALLIMQRLNGTAEDKTHYLELTYVPGESVGRPVTPVK